MELIPNRVAEPGQFGMTETGTSERFSFEWGEGIAWCVPMKSWLTWGIRSGGVWKEDQMLDSAAMMRDTCARQYEESNIAFDEHGIARVNNDGDYIRDGAMNPQFQRLSHSKNALELAKSLMVIHPDSFDRDAWELNTPEGVIDLRSGTLWPHRSGDEDTFLHQTAITPMGKWESSETPMWNKHLDDMCHGDKEIEEYLRRLVGMALVGDQNEKPQLALQLNGLGRNGKGVFLQTIVDALGSYGLFASNRLLTADESAHTTDQTDLEGRRIVVIEEVKRINTAVFNDLTGGGFKTARKIGKDNRVFKKTWTVVFNNNGAMNFYGGGAQSDGTKERITTIDFGKGLDRGDRIDDWVVRLRAEWPGVLAWAVQGCREWQEGGSGFEGLAIPESVREMTETRQFDADPLRMYLNEYYDKAAEHESVLGSVFVKDFNLWCKDSGNASPGGHKFVYQDLRSHHGLRVDIDNRGRTQVYGILRKQLSVSDLIQQVEHQFN